MGGQPESCALQSAQVVPSGKAVGSGSKEKDGKKNKKAVTTVEAQSSSKTPTTGGSTSSAAPRREVVCADAMEWLSTPGVVPKGSLIFTSLPDACEVQDFAPTREAWAAWFLEAVKAVLRALPPEGCAVFYQTDVRDQEIGQVSKSYLVLHGACAVDDVSLIWHKIVHFGSIDHPACTSVQYTHLLCFYKHEKPDPAGGASTANGSKRVKLAIDGGGSIPDLLNRGQKPWALKKSARCMGSNSVLVVLKWALRHLTSVNTIVDPFCGAGTTLAIANTLGLHALGVDISPLRIKQAKVLDGATLLAGRAASQKQRQHAPKCQEAEDAEEASS